MTGSKRRSKDKLPKDVSQLTSDEVMERLFPKKVVKELKKVAHEKDSKLSENDQ